MSMQIAKNQPEIIMLEHKSIDRRKFFKTCAALLAAGVVPIGCDTSGTSEETINSSTVTGSQTLSKTAFNELPSTVFSVSHDIYGVIDMNMTEIENDIFSPETEQFSICLTGPATPEFAEGSYAVYNNDLGNIELFLQPAQSSPGESKYRAVFSLLLS